MKKLLDHLKILLRTSDTCPFGRHRTTGDGVGKLMGIYFPHPTDVCTQNTHNFCAVTTRGGRRRRRRRRRRAALDDVVDDDADDDDDDADDDDACDGDVKSAADAATAAAVVAVRRRGGRGEAWECDGRGVDGGATGARGA